MSLQNLVTAFLDQRGWSLEQFADKAKLSPAGLRKLMRGQVTHARSTTVARLAKVLGIDAAIVRAALHDAPRTRT